MPKSKVALQVISIVIAQSMIGQAARCGEIEPMSFTSTSLTADFAQRDSMPESNVPRSSWYTSTRLGSWGPHAATYPQPNISSQVDPIQWKRQRVIAVAKKYIGLPYQHHHIPGWSPPEGPGLDCSNFTSWVYNYGLGCKFNSNIHEQAEGPDAPGRRLQPKEPFVQGDLLYILKKNHSEVSHCIIYIDETHIIDSHNGSVQIRPFSGWYRECFSHARRIIE